MSSNPIYNAQGEDLLLAGEIDPTVDAIEAKKGSIFLKTGGAPMIYQKQDAGESTNWTQLSVGDFMARDFSNSQASANDIDLGSNKLINVADPTAAQDAATKNYVDTEISGIPAGANTSLSNLTSPTAINQDMLPSAPQARAIGSPGSEWKSLVIRGTSGAINNILVLGNSVSANALNVEVGALGTSGSHPSPGSSAIRFRADAGVPLQILSGRDNSDFYIGTQDGSGGSDSGQITLRTGTAGGTRGSINFNANSYNFDEFGVMTKDSSILATTWGNNFPALELDGTTAQALAGFATGILHKGTGNQSFLVVGTEDLNSPDPSSSVNLYSGANAGTGRTGDIETFTGNHSANGQTGGVTLRTGNSGTGTTGNINLQTGSTTGNKGRIRMLADLAKLPTGTSDPAGIEAGDTYYNTSTNQLRVFNGGVWRGVTLT